MQNINITLKEEHSILIKALNWDTSKATLAPVFVEDSPYGLGGTLAEDLNVLLNGHPLLDENKEPLPGKYSDEELLKLHNELPNAISVLLFYCKFEIGKTFTRKHYDQHWREALK